MRGPSNVEDLLKSLQKNVTEEGGVAGHPGDAGDDERIEVASTAAGSDVIDIEELRGDDGAANGIFGQDSNAAQKDANDAAEVVATAKRAGAGAGGRRGGRGGGVGRPKKALMV